MAKRFTDTEKYWPGRCYVYLLVPQMPNPDRLKIGITQNLDSRKSGIQCAVGQPVDYIFTIPFPSRDWARRHEETLHRLLAKDRLHGEWFRYSDFAMELAVELKNSSQSLIDMEFIAYG
jgi:hypothetical protein